MDLIGFGQLKLSTITVDSIPDVAGRYIIITGASAGVGKLSAEILAKKGAHVIMACRSVKKAQGVVEEIRKKGVTDGRLDVMELDLANLKSVRSFAAEFTKRNLPLHILMNNAGVMAVPKFTLTVDNIEMQTASNHVGHFYLTNLLLPILRRTAADAKKSGDMFGVRIVNLSSMAHLFPFPMVDFDSINQPKGYFSYAVYSQTKRMNILFTRELQKRVDTMEDEFGILDNIYVNAVHPGVVQTELYTNAQFVTGWSFNLFAYLAMIPPLQGALTQLYCAAHSDVSKGAGIKGQYLIPTGQITRPAGIVLDEELAVKLWTWSEKLLGDRGFALTL
ncbi:hypothetical protein HDU67_010130 [Dinochytrium kinnereticum]|nr:hypothetical protein HDU67_010130 [Dinochytrium kinnereticum]